jgi:hypothetical protein
MYLCLMLGMVGLLVLLRVDGLSSRWVFISGFITLGVTTFLFQRSIRSQTLESRFRKKFEWCAGMCFLALLIAHFVMDSPLSK